MKKKFQKSYSLTIKTIHIIALAAKKENRTPSDFLDLFIIETLGKLHLKKKRGSI